MNHVVGIYEVIPGDASGIPEVRDRGLIEIYIGDKRVAIIDSLGEEKISISPDHPMYNMVKQKLHERSWFLRDVQFENLNKEINAIKEQLAFLMNGMDIGKIEVKIETERNIDVNDFIDNVIAPYMRARYNVMQKYISTVINRFVKKMDEEINKKMSDIIVSAYVLMEHGIQVVQKNNQYYYYYPEIIPKYVMKNQQLYELKNDDKKYYIKGLYIPITGKMYTAKNIFVDDAHHVNVSSSNLVCVGNMNGEEITPENVLKLIDALYTLNLDSPYFHIPEDDIGRKLTKGIKL